METQTINSEPVNQEVGGIVSPDAQKFDPDSSNTFHDLDEPEENKEEEASAATAAKAVSDGEKEKEAAKAAEKATRYDQDPAWQRIIKERDEAREKAAKLEGRLEGPPEKKAEPAPLPFKDISTLTAEQIREWMEDDPKGFAENIEMAATHKATHLISRGMQAKYARDLEHGNLKKTYEAFEEKNPDFRPLWDSGEIIAFIEANSGHNPISAYHEMTREKRIQDAVAEATKKTETEVTKRILSKKNATVLSGGPAGAPRTSEDPALSNTKQHGGLNAVLAEKLATMRRAGGK